MDYRYGSHTVFNISTVWVTKYRYKVLAGNVAIRVRELVRQICEIFEIRIITGVVSKDHVNEDSSVLQLEQPIGWPEGRRAGGREYLSAR